MKIDALFHGEFIICGICHGQMMAGDQIDWDHGIPLKLGGPHHYTNLFVVHRECHRKKTFGTKATSAGSDIHKIAKAKRIAKGKMAVRKLSVADRLELRADRVPGSDGRADLANSHRIKRKLPSRGFSKPPEGHQWRWGR